MGAWVLVVCFFGAGYSLAGGALGLRGSSPAARVAWGVALGVAGVFLVVPAIMVWALSGGLPSIASISAKVWGFVAGGALAGVVALNRSRGRLGGWVLSGGMRRAAVGAAGIVLVFSVGFGLQMLVNGGGRPAAQREAAAVVEEAAPSIGQSPEVAGCDCSTGAVCIGPKGGRYCLRPDGSKKYGQ